MKKMILMYHRVSDKNKKEGSCTGLYSFISQMFRLKKSRVVYLDDYDPNDEGQVVISFDDAYFDVWKNAVPLLKEFNYPFEVFVVTHFLENRNCMNREILVELSRDTRGRLQFHGNMHRELGNLKNPEEISAEIKLPEDLKQLDPEGFHWFAYPFCSYNHQVKEAVQQAFKGAVSGKGMGNKDQYCLERLKITEDTDWQKYFPPLSFKEKAQVLLCYLRVKVSGIFRKKQIFEK